MTGAGELREAAAEARCRTVLAACALACADVGARAPVEAARKSTSRRRVLDARRGSAPVLRVGPRHPTLPRHTHRAPRAPQVVVAERGKSRPVVRGASAAFPAATDLLTFREAGPARKLRAPALRAFFAPLEAEEAAELDAADRRAVELEMEKVSLTSSLVETNTAVDNSERVAAIDAAEAGHVPAVPRGEARPLVQGGARV